MAYTIVLIIHLFCAIIFIGHVFTDVVVLPSLKKHYSQQEYQKITSIMSNRARKIFPLALLILVLSGGFMLSKFINSQMGYFSSNLQQILLLKVFLAFIIVCGVIYSLSRRLLGKTIHPMMKHFHKIVLVLGIAIIVIAKIMFIV